MTVKHGTKFTGELLKELYEKYSSGIGINKLSKEYKVSIATVYNSFLRNNLEIRKHNNKFTCNTKYFDKIDSNNKAYVLGFIASDGCLYQCPTSYTLSIIIHPKDVEVLDFIKEELESNAEIKISKVKGSEGKIYDRALFRVHSKELGESLMKIGIYPRKSDSLTFKGVKVPEQFIADYLRGYVDGDGHIKAETKNINIVATEDFCKELKEYLLDKNIDSKVQQEKSAAKNLWSIRFLGENKKKFLNFLDYNEFALSRKKKEVLQILN